MTNRARTECLRAIAALTILLFLLLAACSRPPLKIGFVGPLTGSSSAIGLGCRNGLQMALGKGPAAAQGRIPSLDILVRDDHNDPDACLQAFHDLKAAGCDLVILGTPSAAAAKAVPWAIGKGMLVISPTVSSPLPGDTSGLFMRGSLPSTEFGRALAQVAVERLHVLRVGIVGDSRNSGYFKDLSSAFTSEYGRLGGRPGFVKTFDSAKGQPEAGLVDEFRATGSDALLVIAASTETVLIAKALERAGLKLKLLLPPWPLTLDLIHNGGLAVEGAYGVSTSDLSFRGPAGGAFRAAYRREYGEEPSFPATFGYESGVILRAALASSPSTTPPAIRDRILAIGSFRALQGTIAFGPDGKVTRTMFLFTIEGGAFKPVE